MTDRLVVTPFSGIRQIPFHGLPSGVPYFGIHNSPITQLESMAPALIYFLALSALRYVRGINSNPFPVK
jgi:hypothetical protein